MTYFNNIYPIIIAIYTSVALNCFSNTTIYFCTFKIIIITLSRRRYDSRNFIHYICSPCYTRKTRFAISSSCSPIYIRVQQCFVSSIPFDVSVRAYFVVEDTLSRRFYIGYTLQNFREKLTFSNLAFVFRAF